MNTLKRILIPCSTYLLLSVVCLLPANGQTPNVLYPANETIQRIKPFVDETTFMVVRIEPKSMGDLESLHEKLKQLSPVLAKNFATNLPSIRAALEKAEAMSAGQAIYQTIGIPYSDTQTSWFLFFESRSDTEVVPVQQYLPYGDSWKTYRHQSMTVVSKKEGSTAEAGPIPASTHQAFTQALKAIESYPIQIAMVPPSYAVRTFRELSPQLPSSLGGGSSDVLTDGIEWMAIGIDPQRLNGKWIIQSQSPDAASALADHLPKIMRSAQQSLASQTAAMPPASMDALLAWITPTVQGSQLVKDLQLDDTHVQLVKFFAGFVGQVEGQAQADATMQQFKAIMLAMHNFHDVHKHLPPGDSKNKEEKPLLSWRVYLLPFLGEADLYDQFHLNEPWDSEHNLTLLERMPAIYASKQPLTGQTSLPAGHTTFVAPRGERTIFPLELEGQGTRFSEIIDGLSNTVAIVEVTDERAVPWTSPQDYAYDVDNPAEGLQTRGSKRWLAGIGDGSVRRFPASLDAEMVRRLFDRADGNPIETE